MPPGAPLSQNQILCRARDGGPVARYADALGVTSDKLLRACPNPLQWRLRRFLFDLAGCAFGENQSDQGRDDDENDGGIQHGMIDQPFTDGIFG